MKAQKRFQCLVAQLREDFDAVAWSDAVACLGVDVARVEVVLGAYTFDFFAERQEDLERAVVGAAFYDGQCAVLRTEEAQGFDNGAEQAGKEARALMEVERKEIQWARTRSRCLEPVCGIGLEVMISMVIRDRAVQPWKSCVFRIHDGFDIGWCLFEQSGIAIFESRTGLRMSECIGKGFLYYSSRFFVGKDKT